MSFTLRRYLLVYQQGRRDMISVKVRLQLLGWTSIIWTGLNLAPTQTLADPLASKTSDPIEIGESTQEEVIIVVGRRRGVARGNPTPIETVNEQQLESARGLSISEVVGRLAQSGQNNPRILVNGRPADTTITVGSLPSEAIARIEILPPATASLYGEPVSGRVVNIVLKSQFRTIQANPQTTLQEGADTPDFGALIQRTHLQNDNQTVLGVNLRRAAPRFEDPDLGQTGKRLVSPDSFDLSTSVQLQRTINENSLWSINAGFGVGQTEFTGSESNEPSTTDRTNWSVGTVLSGSIEKYFYSLGARFGGNADERVTDLQQTTNSTNNGGLNFSVNGPLVMRPRSSIQALLKADYRWSDSRNGQVTGTQTIRSNQQDEQLDWRAGLTMPWSNKQDAKAGALTTSIGFEALNREGDWGRSLAGSFSWTPFLGLTLDGTGNAESIPPTQALQTRPLTSLELAFDSNSGTYREVTVLRDDGVLSEPVDSSQIDLRVNYETQTALPINIGLNLGRSTDSGRYDQPQTPSENLELRQPSRYIRDSAGTLTTVDLRTRKLDARTRDTIGLRLGAIFPLGSGSIGDAGPATGDSAASLIAADQTIIDVSIDSQWLFVPKPEIGSDEGLGEPTHRINLRVGLARGTFSLALTLDHQSGQFLRDTNGSLVEAPQSIYGALEVSMPVSAFIAGPSYLETAQIRASFNNLLLVRSDSADSLSLENRRLLDRQRSFSATVALSFRF
jgi:hypothetical protein